MFTLLSFNLHITSYDNFSHWAVVLFIAYLWAGIGLGKLFEIKMEDILDGIANFELTKRRMQIEKNKLGAIIINDCYNANYDSMKAALEYLGNIKANKKIAVLGDMLELGEFSKMLHEKVGEEVAKNKVDILITVGEQSRYIAKEAKEKGIDEKNIYSFNNNEEAIKELNKVMEKNDAILIKASNGMKFQEIFEKIM